MKVKSGLSRAGKFLKSYRKIVFVALAVFVFWTFGLGALAGFFLSKGGLARFPQLKSKDRVLVLAPHIDDEVIGAGGLIQESLKVGAKVKVIYLTNGDDNVGALIRQDRKLDVGPNDFLALGQERMQEGRKAAEKLGLGDKDLVFLGFPDEGLYAMFNKNYSQTPFVAHGTKLSFNPYRGTYKERQDYLGENVVSALTEIMRNFAPTIVIVSHVRDRNSDHRAAFLFAEKALEETNLKPSIYSYLVHYPYFPYEKRYLPNQLLYPPKKLFTRNGWFSFELSQEEEAKKLEAVKQNVSEQELGKFYNLLQSFVKRNEIFEAD